MRSVASTEARAEATALWQELRQSTQGPNAAKEDATHMREYWAAVHEALGEDRRAAETYAGRIEQQALLLPAELNAGAPLTCVEACVKGGSSKRICAWICNPSPLTE